MFSCLSLIYETSINIAQFYSIASHILVAENSVFFAKLD